MKRYQRIILGGALPWLWIGTAQAGGQDVPTDKVVTHRAAQALAPAFDPHVAAFAPLASDPRLPVWLPSQLELRKGSGLAVSRPIRVGEKDLRLGLAGPVLRKRNLGLAVELRF